MTVLAGTSGFSYKEWVGSFYPDKIAAGDMLGFYATQLPAVEINNTFYRMPKKTVLEGWRDQVPAHFRLSVKASRRITHSKKLVEVHDEMRFLLGNLEVLGDKLGAVLFQLPPFLRKDTARLESFARSLPQWLPAAFEFRHPSWFDSEIAAVLNARNLPWVIADADSGELPQPLATADWGYLRLRRSGYTVSELEQWHERIVGAGWRNTLVFFKHEDDCAGPAMAQRFLALAR